MGPWEYIEWHDANCSSIEVPEVPLSAKMTKMPLVNPRFDRRSNEVKTLTNNIFCSFTSNPSFSDILTTLTKFDPKSTLCGPKNPNFDLIVKTGWNQCQCEYYQILIPTTIHGLKSKLERLRCHEKRDNALIDASLTSKNHNYWSDRWIFKIHTFQKQGVKTFPKMSRSTKSEEVWGYKKPQAPFRP